ncbi:MAG TPA: biotin/lipoyl-binding protein, partial [Candidatus Dormibacteraeota bacterium]|nr:biotin/lipoyl-binding protein [Candidatus Dormibacteraeota bacterium]
MASNPERSSPGNLENAARPRGYFRWIAVVAILVIAGIITALILRKHSENEASAGKGSAGAGKAAKGGPGGQQRGPIPVVLGTVAQKDFPIYLDGLGTVQAFNTVTVRSRVEGQLQKLGFKEGEDVHAGQMLAMIDPAPFQTQ